MTGALFFIHFNVIVLSACHTLQPEEGRVEASWRPEAWGVSKAAGSWKDMDRVLDK